jgi:hypothetical protein
MTAVRAISFAVVALLAAGCDTTPTAGGYEMRAASRRSTAPSR